MRRDFVFFFIFTVNYFYSIDSQLTCGEASSGSMTNGTKSSRSEWPWLVGVFKVKDNKFLCGGSLINENMIITVHLSYQIELDLQIETKVICFYFTGCALYETEIL